jgi:hypothetical protein
MFPLSINEINGDVSITELTINWARVVESSSERENQMEANKPLVPITIKRIKDFQYAIVENSQKTAIVNGR